MPAEALMTCGASDAGSIAFDALVALMGEGQAEQCRRAVPDLKSVHVGVFAYLPPEALPGNLSVYARGEDYHKAIGKRLRSACEILENTW